MKKNKVDSVGAVIILFRGRGLGERKINRSFSSIIILLNRLVDASVCVSVWETETETEREKSPQFQILKKESTFIFKNNQTTPLKHQLFPRLCRIRPLLSFQLQHWSHIQQSFMFCAGKTHSFQHSLSHWHCWPISRQDWQLHQQHTINNTHRPNINSSSIRIYVFFDFGSSITCKLLFLKENRLIKCFIIKRNAKSHLTNTGSFYKTLLLIKWKKYLQKRNLPGVPALPQVVPASDNFTEWSQSINTAHRFWWL